MGKTKPSNMHSFFRAFLIVAELKKTRRTGWVKTPPGMHPRRIREAESVADHSYSLAIQALLAAHALALDPLAMVEMALIHDLPEYKTGDQVTAGLKGPALEAALAKKRLSEEKAMRTIRKRFGVYGNDLYERWLEYNERLTPESRVLAELDKLEAAFQAVAYFRDGEDLDPGEFIDYARTKITDPFVRQLLEELPQHVVLPKPRRKVISSRGIRTPNHGQIRRAKRDKKTAA
jgi:putative hydrolases of HD superfamily